MLNFSESFTSMYKLRKFFEVHNDRLLDHHSSCRKEISYQSLSSNLFLISALNHVLASGKPLSVVSRYTYSHRIANICRDVTERIDNCSKTSKFKTWQNIPDFEFRIRFDIKTCNPFEDLELLFFYKVLNLFFNSYFFIVVKFLKKFLIIISLFTKCCKNVSKML